MSSLFLSILSAVLLTLSFPKPDLGFLAWLALVPWFFTLQQARPRWAFVLSYMVGVVFFSGTLYWVNYVSSLGFTILILYLAFYFAVFGLLFSINHKPTINNLFLIPCIWVTLEYIRGHLFTGLPWALLGYSQYRALPVIQISDVTGAYGVSFLIVLVNVGIWQLLMSVLGTRKRFLSIVYSLLFIVILVLGYGYFRLNQEPEGEGIKVAVVQGNIAQEMKWNPETKDSILKKYTDLTEQTLAEHPDVIIWPETSAPGYLEDDAELLKKIISLSRRVSPAYLLVGTPHVGPEEQIYNSATLLRQGKILQRYDKLHLVPFGEFIPCPQVFSRFSFASLIGNFTPGEDYTVFGLAATESGARLSALICFEDAFAGLARNFVRNGANVLVNLTNDAWFFDSSEPYQHLQASVFRAVENRVNLVRSANTGVSCFINPRGRILSRVAGNAGRDVLVSGQKSQELKIASVSGFYTAFGDIFAWFCLAVTAVALIKRAKR